MISSSHTSAANPNSETLENQSQEKFTAALSKEGYSSSRRLRVEEPPMPTLYSTFAAWKVNCILGAHTELTWGTLLFQDLSLGGFFLASTSFLKSSSFFAMLGIFKDKTKQSNPTPQKILGYMSLIRKDNTIHTARNSIKFNWFLKDISPICYLAQRLKTKQYQANSRWKHLT